MNPESVQEIRERLARELVTDDMIAQVIESEVAEMNKMADDLEAQARAVREQAGARQADLDALRQVPVDTQAEGQE